MEPWDCSGNGSALHCRNRWLALQRLREERGLDALLIVLGPDARFERAGEVLFNWLLNGLSGRELLATSLESSYEDCVVCLQANSSRIFCKRAVQEDLVSKTAMWESCEVITPTSEQERDEDDYETCKTLAFLEMVANVSSLGVVLRRSSEGDTSVEGEAGGGSGQPSGRPDEVKMALEKWPLVQAHAYDEFGLGFLTMNRSVTNLEEALQTHIYPSWDCLAMLQARNSIPKLVKAWDEAMLFRDRLFRLGQDEGAAAAPLVDFFEYGRLALSDEDVFESRGASAGFDAEAFPLNPAPRILVGSGQTPFIQSAVRADSLGVPVPAGPSALPAVHMIWEGIEPNCGLAVCRTYLLGARTLFLEAPFGKPVQTEGDVANGGGGGAAAAAADDDAVAAAAAEPPPGLGPEAEQQLRLQQAILRAYCMAASCCQSLLENPAAAATFSHDDASRNKTLTDLAIALIKEHGGAPGRVEATCTALDSMGLSTSRKSLVGLFFLRVVVSDIRCPGVNESLGSVAYGDSVFATATGTGTGTGTTNAAVPSKGLFFTEGQIPAFSFWTTRSEQSRSEEVKAGLDSCLGVGFDPGPSVALGHRSAVRVYLEKKGPPPDPLNLGKCLDREVESALAWDVQSMLPGQCEMSCWTSGTAWTFQSGKVVFHSSRTGYLILEALRGGVLSATASKQMVWQPVQASSSPVLTGCVALSPLTAGTYQSSGRTTPGGFEEEAQGGSYRRPGGDEGWVYTEKLSIPAFTSEFLLASALAGANCGQLVESRLADSGSLQPSVPCKCVWLSGLPGCRIYDVAASLVLALDAQLVDLAAVLGLGVGATDGIADMRFMASVLAGVVQPIVAQGARTIVVCDVLCNPFEVLSDLAVQGPFAALCQVVHVVSVLDPVVCYPWGRTRHPLLLSRCHRAWVSAVVLQHPSTPSASSHSAIDVETRTAQRERQALASLLRKQVEAARSSREAVFSRDTTGLVSGPLAAAPSTPSARLLALPEAPGCAEWLAPKVRLRCAFVPVTGFVDMGLLRESIASSLDLATADPVVAGALRGLFCVEARVPGLFGEELVDLSPEELLSRLRGEPQEPLHKLVMTGAGQVASPDKWPEPLASRCGVLFWWCIPASEANAAAAEPAAARRAAAEQSVEESRLQAPSRRQHWTVQDLPESVLADAREHMLTVELPEGFFFDGGRFVHVDGLEQRDHPSLGSYLDLLVSKHNADVDAWNAAADEASRLLAQPAPSLRR